MMPRVSGKRSPRWPWLIFAVAVIVVVVFVVLWATDIVY
jgi:ABC-type transporter Mla subunit MlaD